MGAVGRFSFLTGDSAPESVRSEKSAVPRHVRREALLKEALEAGERAKKEYEAARYYVPSKKLRRCTSWYSRVKYKYVRCRERRTSNKRIRFQHVLSRSFTEVNFRDKITLRTPMTDEKVPEEAPGEDETGNMRQKRTLMPKLPKMSTSKVNALTE